MSSKIHVGSDESKLPVWTKSLSHEKKADAVKVADKKTSNRAVGGASAIQGHSSRKNKGAASERTGSNASKANTGKGNWI